MVGRSPARIAWRRRVAAGLSRVRASLFRGSSTVCIFGDLGGAANGSLDVNRTVVESSRLSSLPDRPVVTARMAGNRPGRLAWPPQRMDLHVSFLCRRRAWAPLCSDTSCRQPGWRGPHPIPGSGSSVDWRTTGENGCCGQHRTRHLFLLQAGHDERPFGSDHVWKAEVIVAVELPSAEARLAKEKLEVGPRYGPEAQALLI